MQQVDIIKKVLVLLLTVWYIYISSNNSNAQKTSEQKKDIISYILSDTLNPEFFLIPIKFNFKNNTNIWISCKDANSLYQYFKDSYGWDKKFFIKQMSASFVQNKPIEVNEDKFFSIKNSISSSECDCLFNEDSSKLKQRIFNEDYYKYPDNRFICFVYKCLKNGVILCNIEGRIVYKKMRINEY